MGTWQTESHNQSGLSWWAIVTGCGVLARPPNSTYGYLWWVLCGEVPHWKALRSMSMVVIKDINLAPQATSSSVCNGRGGCASSRCIIFNWLQVWEGRSQVWVDSSDCRCSVCSRHGHKGCEHQLLYDQGNGSFAVFPKRNSVNVSPSTPPLGDGVALVPALWWKVRLSSTFGCSSQGCFEVLFM